MSHIDCFDHSHIGFLANIPVYHPMQKDEEFGFDERSIVIGGGSGEHPMFVIPNMSDCLQYYVYTQSEDYEDYADVETLSYWSIENSYHFYRRIKRKTERLKIRAEEYILKSVGQFLAEHGAIFVAKGYIDQALFERAQALFKQDKLKTPHILIKDPNTSWGKVNRDGKTIWGFTFEDEQNEFKAQQESANAL